MAARSRTGDYVVTVTDPFYRGRSVARHEHLDAASARELSAIYRALGYVDDRVCISRQAQAA
jgi:hypothetical protein